MKKATYALLLICFITLGTYAQEASGMIEVTGNSAAEELPEELTISIPLVVIDSSYLSCSNRLNLLLSDLEKDLESKGIEREDMSTGNYAITENFEYKQGERVRSGFKGQVNLTLNKRYEPGLVDDFKITARRGLARALEKGHPEAYLAKSRALLEGLIFDKDPVLAYAYARLAEQEAAKNQLLIQDLDRWKQQAARYLDQGQIAEAEQLALELKAP